MSFGPSLSPEWGTLRLHLAPEEQQQGSLDTANDTCMRQMVLVHAFLGTLTIRNGATVNYGL